MPRVALTVTTPMPAAEKVGGDERPFAPVTAELTVCTCAEEWGRHAVAKRECRRMAADGT
jgi:hypothetical protein